MDKIVTPAFVYDTSTLEASCERWRDIWGASKLTQLYPLKTNSDVALLEIIAKHVEGFTASSLFEAQLAREVAGKRKPVHFTSPGIRESELADIAGTADHIDFNSLTQLCRFGMAVGDTTIGLRINPQISLVADKRYDPSGAHSKLGATLDSVAAAYADAMQIFDNVRAIHLHNNCDGTNWEGLLFTVQKLISRVPKLLSKCEWINLGGGYLSDATNQQLFLSAIELLQSNFGLKVITEPGAAIVRECGTLVSSVIDIFHSGDTEVVVLDTTINHLPECFEYQFSPDVLGENEDGAYSYRLAGSSCLAGDVFGDYAFDHKLEVGSQITFLNVGAYAAVKSHRFNGIDLPAAYIKDASGRLVLKKTSNYNDFRKLCGLGNNETL